MMQTREIQSLCVEHQRRSDSAETDAIGLKKMLQELTQTSEAEKRHIRYQLEEQLQTTNISCNAEVNEVKTDKDAEIKALMERSEKNRVVLENKIRLLEDVNAKINKEKTACENDNDRLATKIGITWLSLSAMYSMKDASSSDLLTYAPNPRCPFVC